MDSDLQYKLWKIAFTCVHAVARELRQDLPHNDAELTNLCIAYFLDELRRDELRTQILEHIATEAAK